MRYCRFQTPQGPRYALVTDRNNEPWATEPLPTPLGDVSACTTQVTGPTAAFEPASVAQLLSDGLLLPPVSPSKIVCVGRNYREHAAELGNEVPPEPLLFLKPPSSLLAPGGTIQRPTVSERVDFEGELAIVIGTRASKLPDGTDVRPLIRGYTCLNDVTARDLQKRDGQWTRAKGFDNFCAVGPVVTDEIDPLANNVKLTTRLNGEVKQRGETRDLIFPIEHLIRYISHIMVLEPGDIIATGTPSGVGPMQAGDRVEVEIEGIGTLQNIVA